MNKALMFDCETLDIVPTAVILLVGIVEIDLDLLTIGDKFYGTIDINDSMQKGLTVGADTLRWWLANHHEGLTSFFDHSQNAFAFDLANTLYGIATFTQRSCANELWSCGPMDFIWLENAYRKCGISIPWRYNQIRDYRTMREQFPIVPLPEPILPAHHALNDANWQALHLIEILRHIRSMEVKP